MIALTSPARKHILAQLEDLNRPILFFGLKGGGCAGFEYSWEPLTEEEYPFYGDAEEDQIIYLDEGKLYRMCVDFTSAKALEGAIVELKSDFLGKQLTVNNPNAKGSCGCGTSISI